MISKISLSAINRYRATVLVWLIVVIFGALSYTTLLPKEGFPPVEIPIATVSGNYFIDDSAVIDREVVAPLVSQIENINGVRSIRSTARSNDFFIVAEFDEDISSTDGAEKIRGELLFTGEELPEDASYEVQPVSATQFNNRFDILVSVYGTDVDISQLELAAEDLGDKLNARNEIASAEAISLTDNSDGSASDSQRQTSFSRLGLGSDNNVEFYESSLVGVVAADGTDDLKLDEVVNREISEWSYSDDFSAYISSGYANTITTQIKSLESNLLGGLIIVILITWVMVGWRPSLLIALFIPTVVSATLAGIHLLGYTLNTIVLFALVLCLGLIVDNAIVIVEALDAARESRRKIKTQIETAIKKVGLAMLAGTMTTVLVFAPLLFVSGILGDFIRVLPATIILALSISLVTAIVLMPLLATPILLSSRRFNRGSSRSIQQKVHNIVLYLPRRIAAAGSYRWSISLTMVGVSLVFIALGGWFTGKLPFNIFPNSSDANAIFIDIEFENDTSISEAEAISDKANGLIGRVIGGDIDSLSYPQASAQSAQIFINLVPFTSRDTTSQAYIEQLETELDDLNTANIVVQQLDAGPPPQEYPFSLIVYGENIVNTAQLADDIADFITNTEITRSDGSVVQVAEVRVASDAGTIKRRGQRRFVEVSASYLDSDTTGQVNATQDAVKEEFDATRLEDRGIEGDALEFDFGQESENAESFASAQTALFIAVALIYLLLVLQFNSLTQPFLILMAIPFSLFGVFGGLHMFSHELSFFVMIGLVGLVGIVVNNTILLVDYANQERAKGKTPAEAISDALSQRFRPITTTTLTTIAALGPLALYDPFWEPLAITIMFGLLSSTILVLISFPYYFIGIESLRDKKRSRWPQLN